MIVWIKKNRMKLKGFEIKIYESLCCEWYYGFNWLKKYFVMKL